MSKADEFDIEEIQARYEKLIKEGIIEEEDIKAKSLPLPPFPCKQDNDIKEENIRLLKENSQLNDEKSNLTKEIDKRDAAIEILTKKIGELQIRLNNFDRSTDEKTRSMVIEYLEKRYTIKETAKMLGISSATVFRIKKKFMK